MFYTIHTQYGLAKIAEAEAAGIPINLTHIAVGDGNGNDVEPAGMQTQLVREQYRAPVNRVYQVADQPGRFAAEMVIPASVGGFTIREVGVFDNDGGLFVVGGVPATYKPSETDGAFSDTVLRVEFVVSNADIITLQVDPHVAVATQQWVSNTITVCALIPGGTTGQVLRKASNGCGDVEWVDPTTANVVVDAIEERQTLAANQTVVEWATVTTQGLAVYIEGVRLPRGAGPDDWDADPSEPETRILLGKSYAAGTEIVGVINDPKGATSMPLLAAQNLNDVENKQVARANLDVYSKAETDQKAPPGLVAHFARNTAPTGWLRANGAEVSRAAYPELFAAIGTMFGEGDGITTFKLPDLRGEFLRGWDDGRGLDVGRTIGSGQDGAIQSHSHSASSSNSGSHSHSMTFKGDRSSGAMGNRVFGEESYYPNYSQSTSTAGSHSHAINVQAAGGPETRPRNVALLACIKF